GEMEPARADLEKSLKIEASGQAAGVLADLLLLTDSTGWTALTPTEMKSEGGATLKLLPDGSILVSGTNPDRDAYTITSPTSLQHIRAIRPEALPDSSLPANGPGRHPSGNFWLNEFRVLFASRPVALHEPFVTFDESSGAQLPHIVDGKLDENHWGVYSQSAR